MAKATVAPAPPPQDTRFAMTYEEWLAWPEGEGKQSEWVDGEVIVFMPPKGLHQDVVGFLFTLINVYVHALRLGIARVAPFEMKLEGSSRAPDLLFVAREHLDRLTPERLIGPADLVIEVVSDDSVRRDHLEKFAEYATAGVPEYWLFDPRPSKLRSDFYRLTDEGAYDPIRPDADGRYHSAVLPGFWLRPEWVWQDPMPAPLACLREIAPGLLADATGGSTDGTPSRGA